MTGIGFNLFNESKSQRTEEEVDHKVHQLK